MAITINNTSSFNQTVSGPTHTGSLTIGSGTGRKVIVIVGQDSSASSFSATFDGAAMTASASVTNSGDTAIKIVSFWYDVPDVTGSGSKTIVVSTGGFSTPNLTWYAWEITGAVTGAPEATDTNTADNTVTSVSSTALTCSAGAGVFALAISGSAAVTFTMSGGTVTERLEITGTSQETVSSDAVGVSAGTKTITATATTTSGFKNILALSFAAAPSGTSTIAWLRI